jgi:S-adenosylmethionine hydrolase
VTARPITFLSDYGYADEFAGACRAVIAGIAPAAPIVDLTHGVPLGDVRAGAVMLLDALPYAPEGVHLAVVDPGVGTPRRAVAVRTAEGDRILVGPDNGLLWPALERLGGPADAVELSASPFRLEPVSATFHGRDLFAPVAARLALGAELGEAGEQLDPFSLHRLELPAATTGAGRVATEVVRVDRFGNVSLSATLEHLDRDLAAGGQAVVEAGGHALEAALATTFGDVAEGEALLYATSSGRLALGVNRGSAAGELGLGVGDEVVIRT